MNEQEKRRIAIIAKDKYLSYEKLENSDYMYGEKNKYLDDVWEYVIEIEENGMIWFKKEYNE